MTFYATLEEAIAAKSLGRTFATHLTQPRDDLGRWTSGGGTLNAAHVATVLKAEGIHESRHAEVLSKVNKEHTTRAQVLAHIDSIHATGKAGEPVGGVEPSMHERILQHLAEKGGRNGGEIATALNVPRKEVLDALGDLRQRGHTEKNKFNRDEITGAGRVHLASDSGGPSAADVASGRITVVGGFEAPVETNSGTRIYGKRTTIDRVRLQRKGDKVDIIGEVDGGTASQRGDYHLGSVEPRDGELRAIGGRDVHERLHGIPPEHQSRIHDLARRMLQGSSKSIETDMNEDNTLVAFGDGLKMLAETDDGWRIGGWLVVHDSHDVSSLRDKFLKSTDYDIEDGETRTLYYNHGLDGTMKKAKLGRVALTVKDAGVWMEGEIKKRQDYLKQHVEKIAAGVKAGVFGLSSGVPAHLVERKAVDGGHVIEMWPLSEASITPTPAEPLTSCLSLKSLQELEVTEGAPLEVETKGADVPNPEITDERPPAGLTFEDQSAQVLAANAGFYERLLGLHTLRQSRKSGRAFSQANLDVFQRHLETLRPLVQQLEDWLEMYGTPDADAEEPGKPPMADARDVMKAISSFQIQQARALGVEA